MPWRADFDFACNGFGPGFVKRVGDVARIPLRKAGMHDWPQILERHGPLVWKTVYRILRDHTEALDCAQEVFAEVLERSSSRSVQDWPAFLRWLAVRRALDRLKKRRTESVQVGLQGDVETLPAASPGPEALAEWSELLERVRDELTRLPGQQAEAFWLQCVEGMSQTEIGHQLGVNANAVGVLVHRARQRLRESLAGLNPAKQDREKSRGNTHGS